MGPLSLALSLEVNDPDLRHIIIARVISASGFRVGVIAADEIFHVWKEMQAEPEMLGSNTGGGAAAKFKYLILKGLIVRSVAAYLRAPGLILFHINKIQARNPG